MYKSKSGWYDSYTGETTQNVWFSVFLDFRKVGKFAVSIERPKAKSVSASGGAPDQALCPWIPLGAPPPYPGYRLALRARHGLRPTFKYLPRSLAGVTLGLKISDLSPVIFRHPVKLTEPLWLPAREDIAVCSTRMDNLLA